MCVTAVEKLFGDTLNLTRVNRADMGAYLCIASNGVPPSVSKRIILDVECKWDDIVLTTTVLIKRRVALRSPRVSKHGESEKPCRTRRYCYDVLTFNDNAVTHLRGTSRFSRVFASITGRSFTSIRELGIHVVFGISV